MATRPEESLARVVLDHYLTVRPGETVTVETWDHAIRWARAFVLEARRRHADPTLVVEDEESFFRSLSLLHGRDLPGASPALAERSDAYVYLPGPEGFPRLFALAPGELETVVARHGPAWRRAARRGGVRAARVDLAGATATAAARFGAEVEPWQKDFLRASLVSPSRLARAAEPIVRRLSRAHRVRIRHPNGTDLTLSLRPHSWFVEDGRLDRADRVAGRVWTRIPTGRAVFALSQGLAEGTWESNRPVYRRFGDPAVSEGARFSFVQGRLREYSFERGGAAFAELYARGGRGREVPSALVFGLNPAVVRGPELDDLALGTVSLVLGEARPRAGRPRVRFSYLTSLSEPDLELDGRVWWLDGRAVQPPKEPTGPERRRSPRASGPTRLPSRASDR